MPLEPQRDHPAALIAALLWRDDDARERARTGLTEALGPVQLEGPPYDFTAFTRYYEDEMGPGLTKQLLWFERPVAADRLAGIKTRTLALERALARPDGDRLQRRVNIDPGLVSVDSLVLATTKPSGHRIGIAPGLYGEITLLYERGRYRPMPWTYRDFRTDAAQDFLKQIREHLLAQRAPRPPSP